MRAMTSAHKSLMSTLTNHTAPAFLLFVCVAFRRVASRRVASRRVASRRVASRRVASRRVASRRVPSRRVASRRVASRRVASRRVPSRRCALLRVAVWLWRRDAMHNDFLLLYFPECVWYSQCANVCMCVLTPYFVYLILSVSFCPAGAEPNYFSQIFVGLSVCAWAFACACLCACAHKYVRVCVCVCMYVCLCICVSVCVSMCVCLRVTQRTDEAVSALIRHGMQDGLTLIFGFHSTY